MEKTPSNQLGNQPDNQPGSATGRQKADVDLSRPLAQGDTFLPHERDESPGTDATEDLHASESRRVIRQAEKDITHGLEDTERRGIPSNVPGPGSVLGTADETPTDEK